MAIDLSLGTDVALVRNDATGRFDLYFETSGTGKKGNPRLSNDREHAVLTTLLSWKRGKKPGPNQIEQGGYYWDPAGRRGTLIWTVGYDRTISISQLQSYADDAGQQLTNARIISSFAAKATRISAGKLRLDVRWTAPSGDQNRTVTL